MKSCGSGRKRHGATLKEAILVPGGAVFNDRDEQLHRLYVNWNPYDPLALSLELNYDLNESTGVLVDLPTKVETFSVPVSARYFLPSGLFFGATGTFVRQDVDRQPFSTLAQGTEDFFTFDAAVGFRFPSRRGSVSLSVQNLFNSNFNYQDDSFREFSDEPSIGPYIPERTILGRLTLSF